MTFSGLSKEFRRWNSFGFEQKRKRKPPRDSNEKVSPRRRSLSCQGYSQAGDIGVEGKGRASSQHDIRGLFATAQLNGYFLISRLTF